MYHLLEIRDHKNIIIGFTEVQQLPNVYVIIVTL